MHEGFNIALLQSLSVPHDTNTPLHLFLGGSVRRHKGILQPS